MESPQQCTNPDDPNPMEASYRNVLLQLREAGVPYLIGGAYALAYYAGITRRTKDLDIFLYRKDHERALDVLAGAGFKTEVTFTHWLAKAFCGDYMIDLIFNSGNGMGEVDEEWFEHGVETEVLGIPVKLTPPEEMIWSKAFVMERDRFDGADIMHVILRLGPRLEWRRLLRRFGASWRVLLSYVVLFGFIYPAERGKIPEWVTGELLRLLEIERRSVPPDDRLCQGTLFSPTQYEVDVKEWGYEDGRLSPTGNMTENEVTCWTKAFENKR